MIIHVILFRAYDKNCREIFFDKTAEEIHEVLFELCPTYVTVGILEFTQFEHLPISFLDNFKRPEHKDRDNTELFKVKAKNGEF
jgi:hypothetical protein